MFEPTRRFQSNAEYARVRSADREVSAAAQWQREAETWFDGTVESVDRRLAVCNRLLAQTQSALAQNFGDSTRTAAFDELSRVKEALLSLRADVLNGAQWRHEASVVTPTHDQVRALLAGLTSADRRYVELEAAKVIRNNPDCHDLVELSGRAWRLASLEFSRYGKRRSELVADALAARVSQLARRHRPRRTAAAAPPAQIADFPAELMFL